MITTIKQINMSITSQNYLLCMCVCVCVCVVRAFEIYSISKCQACNASSVTIVTCYTLGLQNLSYKVGAIDEYFHFSLTPQPLATTIRLSVTMSSTFF